MTGNYYGSLGNRLVYFYVAEHVTENAASYMYLDISSKEIPCVY